MNEPTRKSLEDLINDLLISQPKEIDVDGDMVAIDYRFIGDGVSVTDDYFSIIMDGTVNTVEMPR